MLRLIRVILSANVHGFTSGMRQAEHSLGSFLKAAGMIAGGIAAAFMGLPMLIEGLISSIERLVGRVMNLGKELLMPAMNAQRFQTILTHVTGSGEKAAAMFDTLQQMSMQYGFALEDLMPAGQQMAVMLRGMAGEVDPATWERWLNVLLRLHTLRPDVPMQLLARGLSSLVAGDVSTLTRLLDIDVRSLIETLGPEFAGFLEDAEGATETQLGRVTKIGEQAGGAMGDALALAEELASMLGAGQELLEDYGQTFEGQVGRLAANWEHLKLVFGEPILDVLNDALERFLGYLEDHQEDIDAFVRQMGELAAVNLERLIDWLFDQDWESIIQNFRDLGEGVYEFFANPETQAAFANFAETLRLIGEASLGEVRAFFERVDWDAIASALNTIAQAINDIAVAGEVLGGLENFGEPGTFVGALAGRGPVETNFGDVDIASDPGRRDMPFGIEDPAGDTTGDTTVQHDTFGPGRRSDEVSRAESRDVAPGGPQDVNVNVRVTVDSEGNIIAVVDDRVNRGLEEVVSGADRVTQRHRGR